MATITGTSDRDVLYATRFEDEMFGLGGNDVLRGRAGDDAIDGGAGADLMIGRTGDDVYYMDDRNDRVGERFGEGIDTIIATVGVRMRQNIENLELQGRAKYAFGNELDNSIICRNPGGADNVIDGGAGADFMSGGRGADTYYVENAGDRIEESGTDIDLVYSSISFDLGGDMDPGDDEVYLENLVLSGDALNGTGNDAGNRIEGNAHDNTLRGLNARDFLSGGAGNDEIYGGAIADILTGGTGNDRFYLDEYSPGIFFGDRITDFAPGEDLIMLDRNAFDEIYSNGELSSSVFTTGSAAQDADDRIIYDSETGRVYYDPDGTGSATLSIIAIVPPGTELSNTDFIAYT